MSLTVRFEEESWELTPGDALSFGRAADICVDESNLYLHRVVGELRYSHDLWWLHNLSSWVDLDIRTERGSHHEMAPKTRLAIVVGSEVHFKAGNANYMITLAPHDLQQANEPVRVIAEAQSTNQFGLIELNGEQLQLLAALCEHRLLDNGSQIPSNQAVANRLGWTITKFNRKLDYLCRKLADEGVAGLRGGIGRRASSRRESLVDHAVSSGLVTVEDLATLD
ncbi:MAG: hypothetical protein ACR2PK_17380 [Acidimicrobiales bacterium]